MNNAPSVLPIEPAADNEYDIAIGTVGYESRSSYLARLINPQAKVKVAAGFKERRVLHYDDNRAWYAKSGYQVQELEDSKFKFWCEEVIRSARPRQADPLKVWVDISSTSRLRMATMLETIRSVSSAIDVDFFYAIAKYTDHPASSVPNCHVGPVTKSFSGWSEPDRPAVAIVGLGYEQNKALGAVEHIQATDVWVFIPHSDIEEYLDALLGANSILLEKIPKQRQVDYVVERPFDCFARLESLVNRVAHTGVPVLFPFGPKIFTLCALLVGCVHGNRVAVWRVSTGQHEEATDREASGQFCALRVAFNGQKRSFEAGPRKYRAQKAGGPSV